MTEHLTKTALPTLRFPEFEGAGEWAERMLKEILKEARLGGNYENSEANNGIPVIKMGNLSRGSINIERLQFLPTEMSFFEEDILTEGDLLFNTRNTLDLVGKVAIWRNELSVALYNSNLLRLSFHPEAVASNYFMNYRFNTQSMILSIRQIATGTTSVAAIYTKDLLQLKFTLPSILAEQQKIAATLSSLDELIAAESEKLQALKTHKRGLMQGLFPAEGETVPRLRFAEFEGEWDEKRLGDVANIITGNTPSTSDSENYGGERLFVSPADINDDRYIFQTKTTLSEKGYLKTRRLRANSILVVCIGSTIGKVAQNKVECATNQQINALIPNDNYSNDFIYSTLEFNSHKLTRLAGRQAVPIINKSTFSAIKMPFPSLEEQQKIAATLSSLDALLTAQSETIEALKLHKKGLMQGLFPAFE